VFGVCLAGGPFRSAVTRRIVIVPQRLPRVTVSLTLIATALLSVLAVSQTTAAPIQKGRLVDLTLRCAVPLQAGAREFDVYGQAGVRDQANPSKWFRLATVGFGAGDAKPNVSVVIRPRPETPGGNDSRARTLAISDSACRRASATVPFSRRGLGGGPASQLGERFECVAPRRVLVRVQAELRRPTSFRGATAVPLRSGRLAVRSEAGTPLVYAEVAESGTARLFFAGNCVRD
jgi:hypothetical protein